MSLQSHSFDSLSENRLLNFLTPNDRNRLLARMTAVSFGLKDVLYNAGGPMPYVYFPRNGVISSVTVMADGRAAEVAATGREGVIGLTAYYGAGQSPEKVFCQIPCDTWRLGTELFVDEVRRGGRLQALVHGYTRSVMRLVAQHAACNCLHTVEERFAKWLLMSRDRAGEEEFPLTQEFLSYMLGVRRASVTLAAGMLQKAGLIHYRHGKIRIINGKKLESAACECYQIIREEFEYPL
ncbi:MAG TPA: Crp/Fnr family transcriptional regulator [Fimbriiglobus sp.]|jgi:CRP-like cAMP-binding protein